LGETISKLENTEILFSENLNIIDLSFSKLNESKGPTVELSKK